MSEIYEKLFTSQRSDGVNKTLYDRILRLDEDVNLHPQLKKLTEAVGINEGYFLGDKQYRLKISNTDDEESTWKRFIELRTMRGGGQQKKSKELKDVEERVSSWILAVMKDDGRKQPEVLSRLLYFAKYKHKVSEEKIEVLFDRIESEIKQCSRPKLEGASLEQLNSHYAKILEYAQRIKAVQVIKTWK